MATVAQWLAQLEQGHPVEIDLGLERVTTVWQALGHPQPAPRVITVAGTNGKGSTVALLEAVLRAAGRSVACYTSPHLLHYNERIRLDGCDIDDQSLIAAFERVEQARAQTSLSYFEFGTLAAIVAMRAATPEVAILEVGLGGRLDATNIIDADAAIVTSIALDHTDWLGDDLEQIGREKAGVFRSEQVAVGAAAGLPDSISECADRVGAHYCQRDRDFFVSGIDGPWTLIAPSLYLEALSSPGLAGAHQLDNAAAALMALDGIGLLPARSVINKALPTVRVQARCQRLPGTPPVVVDVAHNLAAVQRLVASLDDGPAAVVLGMLNDKDVVGVVSALREGLDVVAWHLVDLDGSRGLSAEDLAQRAADQFGGATIEQHGSVEVALEAARCKAGTVGQIVVLGSFLTAAAALSTVDR